MDRYDSYKASGIEWVGEIPSHWNRLRIKHTVLCSGGSFIDGDWIEAKDIAEEGIKYLTSGNVGVITYKEQGSGYITQETFEKLGCLDVYAGDILISRLNEPISRACIVPELNSRIVTCVDNVIYRPDKSIFDYRFVVYTLNNRYYTEHANLIARGTTMHRISRTTLGGLSIPVPTLAEQQAIADWLDKKCGEINRVIEKQSKRIELLEELKQSVITHAVTRGLNPDATLKPSGIKWVGDVPDHWRRARIKFMLSHSSAGVWGDDAKGNKDDIACFRVADFNYSLGTVRYDKLTYRNISPKELQGRLLKNNDLLVEKSGGGDATPVGRVVRFRFDERATCSNFMHFLSVNENNSYNFLFYYFFALYSNRENLLYFNQTTGLQNLKMSEYLGQPLFIPPLVEQLAIADYLDAEIAKIDAQIAKVNKEIELLQEYKQSIITEVVTGKRKVC